MTNHELPRVEQTGDKNADDTNESVFRKGLRSRAARLTGTAAGIAMMVAPAAACAPGEANTPPDTTSQPAATESYSPTAEAEPDNPFAGLDRGDAFTLPDGDVGSVYAFRNGPEINDIVNENDGNLVAIDVMASNGYDLYTCDVSGQCVDVDGNPMEVATPGQGTEGIGVFPESVDALETLIDPNDFVIPAGDYDYTKAQDLAEMVNDRMEMWTTYFYSPDTYDDFVGYLESAQDQKEDWSYYDFADTRSEALANTALGTLVAEDYTPSETGDDIIKNMTGSVSTNLAIFLSMEGHLDDNNGERMEIQYKIRDGANLRTLENGDLQLDYFYDDVTNLPELPAYTGDSAGSILCQATVILRQNGDKLQIVNWDIESGGELYSN